MDAPVQADINDLIAAYRARAADAWGAMLAQLAARDAEVAALRRQVTKLERQIAELQAEAKPEVRP